MHRGRSNTKVSVRPLLHAFHIQCMTILGVPGWAPTEDTHKAWAKAHLSCNPSHQVWTVGTSGKGNTLSYQRKNPLDPYMGWRSMCNGTSRRKGRIGIITSSQCALSYDRVRNPYTNCHVRHFSNILFSDHSVPRRVIHGMSSKKPRGL